MKRDDILTFNREQLKDMTWLEEPMAVNDLERILEFIKESGWKKKKCMIDHYEELIDLRKSGGTMWNVYEMFFCPSEEKQWACERQVERFSDFQKAKAYADKLNKRDRTTDVYIVTDLAW